MPGSCEEQAKGIETKYSNYIIFYVMRKELESIKKIEDYLSGQLSADEKAGFEKQLANDPQLREDVMLQRELMRGVERAALQQQVKQAGQQFIRRQSFARWGWGGVSVAAIVIAVLYFVMSGGNHQTTYAGKQLPAFNEAGEKLWADADKNIVAQVFTILAGRDTVIETSAGMVLAVPANGFLDEDSKPVTGELSLIVKEALDAASVMRAGLSSMSGNQLLESGGMFFIDARKGEKSIKINPAAGIYTEVPADTIKPGMQLYSGKRLPDGRIDWVTPVPLEHELVTVDILSLDFYPPHYLDSLKAWGYDSRNKTFTDSLYYSISTFFRHAKRASKDTVANEESSDQPTGHAPADSISVAPNLWFCGIDPAAIKTIWNTSFQNTLLATREFEARMPSIHRAGDGILDLYINNLDKNLYEIDSMAALQASGAVKKELLAFAARRDGKVKKSARSLQKLRKYYQSKKQAYIETLVKTQEAFWKRQATLDKQADQKKLAYQNDSVDRVTANFREEFDLNLKEAARQLGYDSSQVLRLPDNTVYSVEVVNTGWYNIDRAVYASTLDRTTLDFTDSSTGKNATIQYLPVSFQVEQANEYDRLYVYLLPDGLSSFMRLTGADGKYAEKLNELMAYSAVIIGYKGEQAFLYTLEEVKPQGYTGIRLTAVSHHDLEKKLHKMEKRTQGTSIQKELDYFRFENTDQPRRKKNQELQDLTIRTILLLYPCWEISYP